MRIFTNFATEMQIREIINTLEGFAPLTLQEEYDNAGVQIQSVPDEEVSGVLLCLDVTEDAIDEAIRKGCNMIVSHHPLLFRGKKKITTDDYIGRCVIKAIRNGICLYAAHTNLDNARGGVNYQMAAQIGLRDVEFLVSNREGTGGSGIIGRLPAPMKKDEFIEMVSREFRAGVARFNDSRKETVSVVALCGGAGSFLVYDAIRRNADAFITGEIGYHDFFGLEDDILLVELGHYETEQYTVKLLHGIFSSAFPELRIEEAETVTNPVRYYGGVKSEE